MRLAKNGALTGFGKRLVIVAAVWALATILPDIYRVAVPFWTVGFVADADGYVTQITGRNIPLRRGDRIALGAMSCAQGLATQRCADAMSIVGGMGGLTYVTPHHPPIHYLVARGTSAPFTVTVTPQPIAEGTPRWVRVALALDEVGGVFFTVIALVLVWESPGAMTAGFFLFALWFNPGQYFAFYALMQPHPQIVVAQEILQSLMQSAAYAGLVIFAIRFPQNDAPPAWRRAELPLAAGAYAVTLVLQLWSFSDAFGGTPGVSIAAVTSAAYLVGYAIDVLVVVILFARLSGQPAAARQRLRWVAWGCTIGFTGFIFADSNEAAPAMFAWLWNLIGLGGLPSHQAAFEGVLDAFYALDVTIAIAVFYAVRHHHVVNVNFAVSRAVTLLVLWIVEGVLLAAATLCVENLVDHRMENQPYAFTYVAVVVILLTLTFERVHEWLNDRCDLVFFPQIHHAERMFEETEVRLADTGAYDAVDQVLVEVPLKALAVTSSAVFRSDGRAFERRGAFGWESETTTVLEADGMLARYASGCKTPFALREAGPCADVFPSDAMQPTVCVPIWAHGELLAIALYGPHDSGDALNRDEFAALRGFAANVARAYDRAEIISLRNRIALLDTRGVPAAPA